MKPSTKLILALVGIILLLVLAWRLFWPKQEEPQTTQNYTKPTDIDRHREGTAQEESPVTERGTTKISVTVRDTVKPQDKVGAIKEHRIEVVVPPGVGSPLVRVDAQPPPQSDVQLDVWKAPWFEFAPQILIGAGVNRYLEPTLTGGVSLVRLWERLHGGADLDRFGAGLFAGWEIRSDICVYVDWKLIEYHNKPVSFAVGIGVTL